MRIHTKRIEGLAIAMVLTLAGTAWADFITPTKAWASSFWTNANAPAKMIDSSGLSANNAAATHTGNGIATDMWLGGGNGANDGVIFDLGAVYDLTDVYIWQMNQTGFGRAVLTLNVYETNNSTWTQIGGTLTLSAAGAGASISAQQKSLVASGVRYIRFDLLSGGDGGGYIGLSEVRFEGTLVSTPSGWQTLALSNPGSGTLFNGAPANILTDAFDLKASGSADVVTFGHDPYFGGFSFPRFDGHTDGFAHGVQTRPEDINNYVFIDVTTGINSLDFIDIYANDDAWAALQTRFTDVTFRFYDAPGGSGGGGNLLGTSAPWSGIDWQSGGGEELGSWGRFDVSTVIALEATRATIQSFELDLVGQVDYFEFFEIRAIHGSLGASLLLSGNSVASNAPTGTLIGALTLSGAPTPTSSYSFSLVAGPGDTDNGKFAILNTNEIRSKQFLPAGSYSIRVQADDGDAPATTTDEIFTINSSAASYGTFVAEADVGFGTPVGGELIATLVAGDADGSAITTFSIVGGRDDLFQISGNQLQQKAGANPGAGGSIHYITLLADGAVDTYVSVKIEVATVATATVIRIR